MHNQIEKLIIEGDRPPLQTRVGWVYVYMYSILRNKLYVLYVIRYARIA